MWEAQATLCCAAAGLAYEHAHGIVLLHDEGLCAIDLDLGVGPLFLRSTGTILPSSLRAPGPRAMTSPRYGFSATVSEMMVPPEVLDSLSTRRRATARDAAASGGSTGRFVPP